LTRTGIPFRNPLGRFASAAAFGPQPEAAPRGEHPEFVTDLPEGKTVALRDVRRWQRLERRHAKARQRKGQRAYNRAQRAERVRVRTIEAQINVLRAEPDSPWYNPVMADNVLVALHRKYGDEVQ